MALIRIIGLRIIGLGMGMLMGHMFHLTDFQGHRSKGRVVRSDNNILDILLLESYLLYQILIFTRSKARRQYSSSQLLAVMHISQYHL